MRNHIANSAEPKFAAFNVALDLLAILWPCAFSHDNKRAKPARDIASFYRVGDFLVIERGFLESR